MFFSIASHDAGPRGDMPKELFYPTTDALRYFSGFIAGPRGYGIGGRAQSIRRYLGLREKPQVLWFGRPGLGALPPVCVRTVAGFVGEQAVLRATCKRFAAAWLCEARVITRDM